MGTGNFAWQPLRSSVIFSGLDEQERNDLAEKFRYGLFLDRDQTVLPRLMSTLAPHQGSLFPAPTNYQAVAVVANIVAARGYKLQCSEFLNVIATLAAPVYIWMSHKANRWAQKGESDASDIVHDAIDILVRRNARSSNLVSAIQRSTSPYVIYGFLFRYMWDAARRIQLAEERQPQSVEVEHHALQTASADSLELTNVKQAVTKLPRQDRYLLHLRFTEGLSFRKIALVLGMPKSTVARRLDGILDQLR